MENNTSIQIGKRIAEIRRAHKITQEVLAERLGLTPKHISHVERGLSSYSLKNLMEFCELFDCSLDYIIFGNSNSPALSKLPEEILHILNTGSELEIARLNRYLQIYVELLSEQE